MVEDVLDLADRPVSAIMTPRPDVVWLNIDGPEAATIEAIRECPYAATSCMSRDIGPGFRRRAKAGPAQTARKALISWVRCRIKDRASDAASSGPAAPPI